MSAKRLQSAGRPNISAPQASADPIEVPRPTAAELLRLASADQSQPPAVMREQHKTVLVNFRVTEKLATALASAAIKQGITQKVILARALQASGLDVPPEDLQDRSPRRRGK